MSIRFLVIPHIQISHANAMQAWWLMAPPSPMTVQGFVRAMGLKCGFHHKSVALALHDVQWLTQEKGNRHFVVVDDANVRFWNHKVLPQQPQGATYIDGQDHIQSSFAKGLQPTARCHAEMSVVVDIGESPLNLRLVNDFLWSARIGGGAITEHGEPCVCASTEEALKKIGGGFWIMDRADLALQKMQEDRLSGVEAVISVLGENARHRYHYSRLPEQKRGELPKPKSWLSANLVGFAALEDPKQRIGVREDVLHAYAEPLVGLIQYRSIRAEKRIPFWQYHTAPNGVYLMKGN
ncbi:type I-F CRISPR-associated protein Csy2 [Acidithiobacillus montserratensis]|uniref:Type I-F CRISPR-associated protein Csy2 n=1 Tax=Acidithiobacillus montserratensis TaxID=2729135 RepID=A0ACD5HL22_9PROT|nr:type I-F CRISPR-associated protein Csy2 [Acidithiobacillus montserratensis]MBU2746593.1 hypothetical protein [Acidithiobacillus montserratensis]